MARCDACGKECADEPRFCPACGQRFIARNPPVEVSGESGAYYCYNHKREVTRVTCGRCEKPICTRCIVMSSAGVRCRQCASYRTPVRFRGVLHDAAHRVGPIDGRKIWYLYIFSWIIRFFSGWFR